MFYDVYQNLCKDIGKSATGVALELNIARSTVSNWKKTGTTPQADILQKVADYFNVSIDYLLEKENEKTSPTESAEDETLEQLLNRLKNREEMKMLFKLADGATKEDVLRAVAIIEALNGN